MNNTHLEMFVQKGTLEKYCDLENVMLEKVEGLCLLSCVCCCRSDSQINIELSGGMRSTC
jgi:hypothetical protein